jgi:hypothetical protein
LKDRRLRLIHSGRLLTDGILLYSWLASLEERQKRAAPDDEKGAQNATATPTTTTWMHCSVGPKLEAGEEESDEGKTQVSLHSIVHPFLPLNVLFILARLRSYDLRVASTASLQLGSRKQTSLTFDVNFIANHHRTTWTLILRPKKNVRCVFL